jgi:hypothetical protein
VTDEIERLEQATAAAKTATREAHEAIKDLRDAARDARAAKDELAEAVNQRMVSAVEAEVEKLVTATTKAITDAEAAVYRRFDRLTRALMEGEGEESLERLAANWRAQARQAREDQLSAVPEFWVRGRARAERFH